MKPQFVAPDYGKHNADMEATIARVEALPGKWRAGTSDVTNWLAPFYTVKGCANELEATLKGK